MVPQVTEWIKALQEDEPAACASASASLAALGAGAVAALLPLLADARPAVRARAVSVLGQIGPPAQETLSALYGLLSEPEGPVRDAAAEALERIAPGYAARRQHRHRVLQGTGLVCLGVVVLLGLVWAIDPFAVTRVLRGLVRGEEFFRRRPASYWAEELNGGRERREAAAIALKSGGLESVPVLKAIAGDQEHTSPMPLREQVIQLLGELRRTEAVPALAELLRNDNPRIRLAAVRALGGMGQAAGTALSDLYAVLNQPEEEGASSLREPLAGALAQIGGDQPVRGVFWQHHPEPPKVCDWKSLAFSADGWMLLAHRDDEIHTWSLTGTPWYVFTIPQKVRQAVIHPDGRQAVVKDGSGHVNLWDLRSSEARARFGDAAEGSAPRNGENGPCHLATSADGRYLAVVGQRLQVYDLTQFPYKPLTHWEELAGTPTFYKAAFSPDGATLAVAAVGGPPGDSRTEREAAWWLFDLKSGKLRHHLPLEQDATAFSPDGQLFVTLGASCRCGTVWDVLTGKKVNSIGDREGRGLKCVAFCCDNRTVAVGGYTHHLSLWDARTGQKLRELNWHRYPVTAVTFSPDGQTLASADERGWVKLWGPSETALAPCSPGVFQPIIPWR